MKKFFSLALMVGLALSVSSVAYANICAFDAVPAATLLYPYVVYDYSGVGETTLFSVINVSAEPQVVHFTLWTDYSTAILDWNVLLTGYDMETFNIRDILADGDLPQTGDTITNFPDPVRQGPVSFNYVSDWLATPGVFGLVTHPATVVNANYGTTCTTANPTAYGPGVIDGSVLDSLEFQLKLIQRADRVHVDCLGGTNVLPDDYWAGYGNTDWWDNDRGDSDATWMYITADVATRCSLAFPSSTGYFTALGEAVVDESGNVLTGDVLWVDNANSFAQGDKAVHIEADAQIATVATLDDAVGGNPMTFYKRYTTLFNGEDNREALPTAWAFRYSGAGDDEFVGAVSTEIRTWKGSMFQAAVADLNEAAGGIWEALDCLAYTYYAWDVDEQVITDPVDDPYSHEEEEIYYPNLLPLETQEVAVYANKFNLLSDAGWMLFIWPASNWNGLTADPMPDAYQTWMGVKYQALGRFSAFVPGTVMANFNCFADQVMPNLGAQYDYVDALGYTTNQIPAATPLP